MHIQAQRRWLSELGNQPQIKKKNAMACQTQQRSCGLVVTAFPDSFPLSDELR